MRKESRRVGQAFVLYAAREYLHVTQSLAKLHCDWTMPGGLHVPTLSMQVYRSFSVLSTASKAVAAVALRPDVYINISCIAGMLCYSALRAF